MAKSFLTPINLNGLELLNARLQQLATAPSSPASGYIYYDTTRGNARVYGGSTWVDLVPGTMYTDAQAQDAVGALISAGTQSGISVVYSSANKTLSFSVASDAAAATPSLRTLGTGAQQAASGTDSRLSDQRVPTDGSVTNSKVATNAAISADKIADGSTNAVYTLTERSKLAGVSNDAAAGTASQRTLGTGSTQAAAGNDVRLSDARNPIAGSVTNASVASGAGISADKLADGTSLVVMTTAERSKLQGIAAGATNYTDTNARANRLDQFAAPTAAVSFNTQRVTSVGTPVAGTDAANKDYVDSVASGLDVKGSVLAATTANITLSATQTVDGVALAVGNRVLVKNQSTASDNGIYVVASGAWTRATDANNSTQVTPGMFTFVEQGTANGDTGWVLTTDGAITVGTTALTFAQFSGAGTYTAGNGLQLTGSAFSVRVVASGGILAAAGGISLDTTIAVRKYAQALGDGSATSFTVTHNLANQDCIVRVYRNSSPFDEVEVDINHTSANAVQILFGTAPAASAFRVAVQG